MACTLTEITNEDCTIADGGILESRVASCANITGVTVVAGKITGFTMAAVGSWKKFQYDTSDDVVYYNQEGERNGNRHVFNQTSFMKFSGVSEENVSSAEALKDCCCVVTLHKLSDGKILVQGVETVGTDKWQFTKKNAKATVNVMSDTGANESRVEVSIISQSRQASKFLPAVLDFEAIDLT